MLPKHWDCWPRPMLPKQSLWPCDSYLFKLYMSCYKCWQPYWEGPGSRGDQFFLPSALINGFLSSIVSYVLLNFTWLALIPLTIWQYYRIEHSLFGLFRLLTLAGLDVDTIWMIFGSQRKYVYQAVGQIWPWPKLLQGYWTHSFVAFTLKPTQQPLPFCRYSLEESI